MNKLMNRWRLIAMSVGFFGIQHGFSIQFAKMSVIYEKLGAQADNIAFLWLAAPLTGLLIQPIVGYLSDRTWIPFLGRRRPYFLVGSLLAAFALCMMPNATTLLMAASMLWLLDASINTSMEPFRAFVADQLPQEQVADGYAMQTVMIGLGGTIGYLIASSDWLKLCPWMSEFAPSSLHMQFYLCAVIYLSSVLITVISTREKPPEPKTDDSAISHDAPSIGGWFKEMSECVKNMPSAMKHLAVIQLFTWMGLFCMFIFYSVAVAHNIFGATDPHSARYDQGVAAAASSMSVYQTISTVFALILPMITRKTGKVGVYTVGLALAGLGLIGVCFIQNEHLLWVPMIGVGVGWAAILSMPYAILVDHIPAERYGVYLGLFNMFIVIPEIASSVGLGWMMQHVFDNNHMAAIAMGGACMLIAAILAFRLKKFDTPVDGNSDSISSQTQQKSLQPIDLATT